jgi:hypothetical protein
MLSSFAKNAKSKGAAAMGTHYNGVIFILKTAEMALSLYNCAYLSRL